MRKVKREQTMAAILGALALSLMAMLTVATPWVVAAEVSDEALAAVEESFRALPIEDGWLLEPLDEGLGIRTIEIKGDSLAIDGLRISEEELEARLGSLAQTVLNLSSDIRDSAGEYDDEETARADRDQARAEREAARAERSERRRHRGHKDRSDSQVVVGSDLTVEEEDVYRDIVVFGGYLTVDGQVIGDAVSIGGGAEVSGEITGDLAAVGGSIELQDGARVMGDVVSVGGSVTQGDNVEVSGQVIEVPFGPNFNFGNFRGSWGNWGDWGNWDGDDDRHANIAHRAEKWGRHARWFGFFEAGWELIGLLFTMLLACLVLLVARNPVDKIALQVSDEPWKSGLVGLLTQILCVPVLVLVCIVLLVSIIGIPLLLLVPFAILGFILVAFLGYTSVAFWLGNWTERRFGWNLGNPYFALVLGIGLIEATALIGEFLGLGPGPIKFFAAMFVLFGCVVSYLAWTVGLGGAVLTRFGTWGGQGTPASSPPPPPTPDSSPTGPEWEDAAPIDVEVSTDSSESSDPDPQREHL